MERQAECVSGDQCVAEPAASDGRMCRASAADSLTALMFAWRVHVRSSISGARFCVPVSLTSLSASPWASYVLRHDAYDLILKVKISLIALLENRNRKSKSKAQRATEAIIPMLSGLG